jgi:hypothetical protein
MYEGKHDMIERCVHCKKEPYDVYIGRPSKFGNPFPLPPKATEEERIECAVKFEEWFRKQPDLIKFAKETLKGKTLGCWCAPKLCHGDIIIKIMNESTEE